MACSRTVLSAVVVVGGLIAAIGAGQPAGVRGATTLVYIVRHAEKEAGPGDVALSATGKERAEVLQWMLHDVRLDAIYSTDLKRTRDTVAPVSREKKLDVHKYAPGSDVLAPIILDDSAGRTLLVCGHSNTIPRLLRQLGVEIEEKILGGYDDLFVVIITRDRDGAPAGAFSQRMRYPARR